jgi:hypothetical protein
MILKELCEGLVVGLELFGRSMVICVWQQAWVIRSTVTVHIP